MFVSPRCQHPGQDPASERATALTGSVFPLGVTYVFPGSACVPTISMAASSQLLSKHRALQRGSGTAEITTPAACAYRSLVGGEVVRMGAQMGTGEGGVPHPQNQKPIVW